jgi:type IV pilus assembly protein PilA
MTTNLKARLLQHFLKKKTEGGFTLIELLVVIIIIGILSAIALPSFLNQANRAKETEASTYVGSVNRGQQAYRLENPTFSNALANLDVGIDDNTEFYSYTITAADGSYAYMAATPNDVVLKGFKGCVKADSSGGTGASLLKGAANTVPSDADCKTDVDS